MADDEAVKSSNEVVVIETNKGVVKVQLDRENAPITVENFLSYVSEGYYDGLVFHRVMHNFMIQGGGFSSEGVQKKTKAPIKLESDNGLTNKRGTIAMARTMVADSATSQFFINLADNTFLDYTESNEGYAVFGNVIEGMSVVDEIALIITEPKHGHENWPKVDVVIEKVYLE